MERISVEGHAIGRHGGTVTDEQLIVRARTGVAPDLSRSRRGFTPDSTAFYSDADLAQADLFLRQNYLDGAIANAKPGLLRLPVSGDMGMPIGRGYLPVGDKVGLQGPLLRIDGITQVKGWYVYDPALNVWKTETIFPLARP